MSINHSCLILSLFYLAAQRQKKKNQIYVHETSLPRCGQHVKASPTFNKQLLNEVEQEMRNY